MGWMDEYYKSLEEERKKKKKDSPNAATVSEGSFMGSYRSELSKLTSEDEVLRAASYDTYIANEAALKDWKKPEERTWFQKGVFEDGYQFGDVTKAILGTATDAGQEFVEGIVDMPEKVIDAGAWAAGMVGGWFGADGFKANTESFIEKDLYDAEKVVKNNSNGILPTLLHLTGEDVEDASFLGEKSEGLLNSAGQLAGTVALQGVGVPWFVTTGVTSFGGEVENALNQGATMGEAGLSAAISAGAEILTEKISGGIKFGGKTLDDALTKNIARNVSNKVVRTGLKLGLDMVGEGGEEVLSGIMSAVGQKMTYADDQELSELFSSDEAWESFVSGAALGGASSGGQAITSKVTGKDYVSGLTNNEKAVVDKIYNDRIAEAEKDGKLSEKEKSQIYDEVLNQMEKGYIDSDTIEEVLGGDTYKTYKDTVGREDALRKEFEELGNKQNATLAEQARYSELSQQIKELQTNSQRNQFKSQLFNEVSGLTANDRLGESYIRRKQAYQADVTKYDAKQQAVIQKAVDSGVLNNTRGTHEFVDMIAKISADKGVLFDFTNNEKLKDSGFALDGKIVNGYVTKDGVTLNIQAAKSLNSVVGHEITHVLEGTEVYEAMKQTLFEYAKSKGDYQGRYDSLSELYKNVKDANVEAELAADLVGDYLFTDTDFITRLSTEHRNIFQRIYDEIKYLCKVATAGSKEARELEKVKKAFEKAYRENGEAKGDTKYSLDDLTIDDIMKMSDEDLAKAYEELGLGKYLELELDDDILLDDFSVDSISEEMDVEPDVIKILYRRNGLGDSHVESNHTAVMTQKRIDQRIAEHGATIPDYARRYITRISPKDFIDMTVYEQNMDRTKFDSRVRGDLDSKMGEWDYEKQLHDSDEPPVLVIDKSTGQIIGHNGRHRIRALEMAGIESVEIEVELHDEDGRLIKYNSKTIPDMAISSQFDTAIETHISNIIPLNKAHRGEIVKSYGENAHPTAGVKYSISDSEGNQLSKEQQEYFKDSKMRDENGNLKVMYHGSQDAGFHVFDAKMSDDDISFFFTDSNDVASSYSRSREVYEARTFHTAKDMNKFLAEIGYDDYEVVKSGGKYTLYYDVDEAVATSDNLKDLYDEFCDYAGVGEGEANYKVYLNLTNPLEVDAEGRYWNEVHFKTPNETIRFEVQNVKGRWKIKDNLNGDYLEIDRAVAWRTEEYAKEALEEYIAKNPKAQVVVKTILNKTRDVAKWAKDNGYDGVIFKNIVDNGFYANGSEGASTVAIAFNSNQIKSTANAKPTGDADIRYSLSDSDGRELSPAVQKRFANSKVVDSDGRLMSVFHGTATGEFFIFDKSKGNVEGDFGSGFYFTDNEADVSEHYEDGGPDFEIKVSILAERIEAEEEIDYDIAKLKAREQLYVGGYKHEVYLNIENPAIVGETILLDSESYMEQYNEEDYDDYDDYIGDVEQLVADDVDNIVLEVERNCDVDNTDGIAGILWAAYAEGGIGIEDLKKKINDLYLEDSNGNLVGNEVTRQIIESLGYDGIIDPTVSTKWNMDIEPGTKHYIVFKPNQIKSVTNQNPTDDPDIRRSLSEIGEQPKAYGKYNVYGKDVMLEKGDVAPVGVAENATTNENTPEAEIAPEVVVSNMENTTDSPDPEKESIAPVAEKSSHTVLYNKRDGENGWGNIYATAQEALNDAVKSADQNLWDAFNKEIDSAPQNTAMPRGSTPIINALIAVQEDVRQETITPIQGAQLLSEAYSQGGVNALKRMVNPSNGNLFDQYLEKAKQYESISPVAEVSELFPDAPMQNIEELMGEAEDIMGAMEAYEAVGDHVKAEQLLPEYEAVMKKIGQLELAERQRADSLLDTDIPPEMDAPYYGDSKPTRVDDPFENRDWYEIGNRKVKAYMYENPEVKPFFQEEALGLMMELNDTTKGERWYNDELYYESGGEKGFGGTKRHTSASMAELLDQWHMSYADIEKGLKAIIEDHGAENIAAAKKLEFMLNDRLLHGYKDFYSNGRIPPNQDYINLLKEKQINEYSKEAFDNFMAYADEYAPKADDSIAPVQDVAPTETVNTDSIGPVQNIAPTETVNTNSMKGVVNGQETFITTEDKIKNRHPQPGTDAGNLAPIAEVKTSKGGEVKGQQAMYKEAVRNESGKVADILIGQEHGQQKKQSGWKWAKEHILRHGAAVEDLALKTGNRELQAKFDNIRRAESRAQNFIGNGKNDVSALLSVRDAVNRAGKIADFNRYLYHMHNVDRMTLEERFKDTPNKAVYGDAVTAEDSRRAAASLLKANPEFKQYAEEIYGINKYLREMMVDEGIISKETADLWQKMYPHYVPISRAGHEGLGVNVPLDTNKTGVNAPIKKATGGNSDIYDVFETMGSRISQTYKAIAKNRFGVELKNTLGSVIESEATGGVDEVLDSVDAHEELLQEGKNGQSPTFTVFENGERVKFEITDEIYEAMKPSQFTYTNKVLNKANNLRMDVLTTYSPTFAITNPIKDIGDILVNSQHPAKTYATIPAAIKSVIKKDHWYQERMENGGAQDSYFDSQTKTFDKEKSKFRKVVGWLPDKIQKANEAIEQIPRMAEYIASRKMGRSIDVSMLDAARVTTNFGAAGDFTNMLNRNGFTFLGASVEGFNQQVRNVREAKAEGLKGWGKLAGKYLAAGLPAILLNHMLWDDDEEYEELSDYVKQNYYIVAKFGDGKFLRIPKGRAVAVIQDAFQQMENLITGNDEADLESFAQLVMNNLAPNNPLENNIIAPVVQSFVTGKTWYGDDLVPTRLQDMPDGEQYDETTDAISKWLGETFNISPYKLNYLLDQYGGGVSDILLPYLTPEADGGGFGAAFRDKFVTDSVMKNQNVSDFYTKMDELTVNANSMYANDTDVLMSKYMSSVNSEMSKLYQQKREVQNSDLSDKEKSEKIREIQQQIVDLAREGLNSYKDVSIEGTYATVGGQQFRWYEPGEDSSAEPGWKKLTAEQIEKQDEVTHGLGISPSEYWSNKGEYDFAYEYPEKYKFLNDNGVTYEDYKNGNEDFKSAWTWASKNPEKYTLSKVIASDVVTYKKYTGELYDIKADKDAEGKSISGSRKEKVIDYINNMDADYGAKIILYKSEYPSDNTYNYEIIDYLNSRDDITYSEMETILKELGFNVSADGYITW